MGSATDLFHPSAADQYVGGEETGSPCGQRHGAALERRSMAQHHDGDQLIRGVL